MNEPISSDRELDALSPRSFSDVDASGEAAKHAAYLERVAANVGPQRTRWLDGLGLTAGSQVLDAGSGLGEVTRMLAARVGPSGRAIGVDRSSELVERAAAAADTTNVEFRVGDITKMPFDDGSFDAAHSERVFIHLGDPDAAMRELFRVVRPGGRIVIVDPDHAQSTTDADDADLSDLLTDRLANEIANWRSGRHLRSQAVLAGFTDVHLDAEVRLLTDREQARRVALRPMEERLAALVATGTITQARADAHVADQDRRAAQGRFQIVIVLYVVTATR